MKIRECLFDLVIWRLLVILEWVLFWGSGGVKVGLEWFNGYMGVEEIEVISLVNFF